MPIMRHTPLFFFSRHLILFRFFLLAYAPIIDGDAADIYMFERLITSHLFADDDDFATFAMFVYALY
jgi:hypothetical protein